MHRIVNMSSRYQVILCSTASQLKAALDIRIKVFHEEQGFPLDTEVDSYDAQSAHFLLIDTQQEKDIPLGTLRWVPYPPPRAQTTADSVLPVDTTNLSLGEPLSASQLKDDFLSAGNGKLGRLALVSETRGKGLGKKIVLDSEEWLRAILKKDGDDKADKAKTKVTLRLHSQMQVIPFYEA